MKQPTGSKGGVIKRAILAALAGYSVFPFLSPDRESPGSGVGAGATGAACALITVTATARVRAAAASPMGRAAMLPGTTAILWVLMQSSNLQDTIPTQSFPYMRRYMGIIGKPLVFIRVWEGELRTIPIQ